jgi:2-polyprenyl-3-methyl-5-hydroxy-6-metoxy-1,4-benzoquinol methylase
MPRAWLIALVGSGRATLEAIEQRAVRQPSLGQEAFMSLFAEPRRVEKLEDCRFYHTMDLPGFGVVPGPWDLRGDFDDYIGGVDLTGKRVLDVGTASGFLTFEAEKRGARVVSFDLADASSQALLPFKDKLYYQNHQEWMTCQTRAYEPMKNSYWLAHRLYGSKAQVHYGNIYQLPETLGQFDVALVGSVTEHLSDQITALASIARRTRDVLVINSPVHLAEEKIACFLASAAKPDEDYTWWGYSLGVYREVLAMLGFGIQNVHTTTYLFAARGERHPRTTIVATRALATATVPAGPTFVPDRLSDLEAQLAATKAELASLQSLGPATLRVARAWRHLADRHPRAFSLAKPIARSFAKYLP